MAIDGVKTGAFQPTTLQVWREFAIRLKNAIEEAHRSPNEALPVTYRNVRRAIEEAGRYLGVPAAPVVVENPASEEQIAKLEAALDPYYAMASGLAADDFSVAIERREELLGALGQLGIDSKELGDAGDIEALRVAFEPVSDSLIDQVASGAIDRVGNAYISHCPMAFKNRGADWLSPSPEILNPYYGSKMLTCGTVKRNLSFDYESAAQPSGEHQKHEHHKH